MTKPTDKKLPIRNPHVSDDQRDALVREWVGGLEYVRNMLHGPVHGQVQSMLDFLYMFGGFGVPVKSSEGQWGLQRWHKGDGGFFLAGVFDSDAQLNDYFAERVHKPSYQEGSQTIFLPEDPMTKTWRGVILYHEVLHAYYHKQNLTRGLKETHWVEEYEIYTKEIAVVRQIFSSTNNYRHTVQKLSERFEKLLNEESLVINDKKAISDLQLAKAMSTGLSHLESGSKRGVMLLDALYQALDRIHADGNKQEHYAITKWFYGAAKKKEKPAK